MGDPGEREGYEACTRSPGKPCRIQGLEYLTTNRRESRMNRLDSGVSEAVTEQVMKFLFRWARVSWCVPSVELYPQRVDEWRTL